jgi:hypothetical protein
LITAALPSNNPDQSCETPLTSEATNGARRRVLLRPWKLERFGRFLMACLNNIKTL